MPASSRRRDSTSTTGWRRGLKVRRAFQEPSPSCMRFPLHGPLVFAGKIQELLSAGILNPLTKLVLVNAIYFKGNWDKKFPESATHEVDFRVNKVPLLLRQCAPGSARRPRVGKLRPAELKGNASSSAPLSCFPTRCGPPVKSLCLHISIFSCKE